MRRVALLRGINVGGKAKVPMADLKKVLEGAGATKVATYIRSGNVVFDGPTSLNAKVLERAIEKHFKLNVAVAVRSKAQMQALAKANPYPDTDFVHVAFLFGKPKKTNLDRIDADDFAPEAFTVKAEDMFVYLPNGVGTSKFLPYIGRRIGVEMTVRNWRTVTKLCEMLG